MTSEQKDLLLKDLCARLPYGVVIQEKCVEYDETFLPNKEVDRLVNIDVCDETLMTNGGSFYHVDEVKPYLFPFSSMTEEEHAIYFKIWEETGKRAYLEGCHHLIATIKAYKAANDYLLSKHYDVNELIPIDAAIDATGLNIY